MPRLKRLRTLGLPSSWQIVHKGRDVRDVGANQSFVIRDRSTGVCIRVRRVFGTKQSFIDWAKSRFRRAFPRFLIKLAIRVISFHVRFCSFAVYLFVRASFLLLCRVLAKILVGLIWFMVILMAEFIFSLPGAFMSLLAYEPLPNEPVEQVVLDPRQRRELRRARAKYLKRLDDYLALPYSEEEVFDRRNTRFVLVKITGTERVLIRGRWRLRGVRSYRPDWDFVYNQHMERYG